MIPFAKGHGLGNDYIVMEEKDLKAPLSEKAIGRICDRNWGVGSDGILLMVPSSRADFGVGSRPRWAPVSAPRSRWACSPS